MRNLDNIFPVDLYYMGAGMTQKPSHCALFTGLVVLLYSYCLVVVVVHVLGPLYSDTGSGTDSDRVGPRRQYIISHYAADEV